MKRFALLVATIAALVLSSVTSASADQLRGNRFAASTAHTTVAKLATSVSPISTAATLGGSTSGILPATGHRAFYEEVQRQWWQWDGAFVVSKGHPGLDPTGALCGKKQNGAAWFLETGDVATERTCRVPAGRLIYMPVAMVICSPLIGYDLRPNELQACASGEFDALDFQFRGTTSTPTSACPRLEGEDRRPPTASPCCSFPLGLGPTCCSFPARFLTAQCSGPLATTSSSATATTSRSKE
ncbi:MAG: hypothetical protein E6I53_16300 [Chloroflexi bacterium]|nr:MAG: hypothetical protein E6I53_16300 [Chloroflexota bacterium]